MLHAIMHELCHLSAGDARFCQYCGLNSAVLVVGWLFIDKNLCAGYWVLLIICCICVLGFFLLAVIHRVHVRHMMW
jgi:hypothetical protein